MSDSTESHHKTRWRLTLVEWALIVGGLLLMARFLTIAILQARDAARLSQSKNNLKQIGLALHNYHEQMNVLPPGGVFNTAGVPYHCWTTSIAPYLSSSPWYSQVDFSVPWDDPTQLEQFMQWRMHEPAWENPRMVLPPRKDGLGETSYAANSWILNRNSSVALSNITDSGTTLLVAEACGHYLPLGCPGNWRNVEDGLNQSADSFGLHAGAATLVLFADGHVQACNSDVDLALSDAMRGPPELRPKEELVQRRPYPYQVPQVPIWRTRRVWTDHKTVGVTLRFAPDGHTVYATFFEHDPHRSLKEIGFPTCSDYLRDLDEFGEIQSVIVHGNLQAKELLPFAELKYLKRLTLSMAEIEGDMSAFRSRLNADVQVD